MSAVISEHISYKVCVYVQDMWFYFGTILFLVHEFWVNIFFLFSVSKSRVVLGHMTGMVVFEFSVG